MKTHNIFIFALFFLAISCKPLSRLDRNGFEVEKLTGKQFTALNGTYSDCHDTIWGQLEERPYGGQELECLTIMDQLFLFQTQKYDWRKNGEVIPSEAKRFKLEFKSKNKAIFTMYDNERIAFTRTLRGRFKNGYFYLRPKVFVIPLFPLAFGYNFSHARIGKVGDDIIIDYNLRGWAFALFAGGSRKGYSTSIHKRLGK